MLVLLEVDLEPGLVLSLCSFGGMMSEDCYWINIKYIAHNLLK